MGSTPPRGPPSRNYYQVSELILEKIQVTCRGCYAHTRVAILTLIKILPGTLALIKILPGNPPDVAAGSHVFGAGTGLPAAAKAPHSLNDWIEEFNCRGQKSTARADGRTSDAKASAKAITMAASSSAIGSTVAALARTRPPSCTKAAPIVIWTQPRKPDAVPAACGRMLTAPAIALGSMTPLPKPITSCGTNTIAGPRSGAAAASAIAATAPTPSIARPRKIMRSTPSRVESREVRKLPAM